MFVPIPNALAVSLAIANASPVTILILTPIWAAIATVDLASVRGGSDSGSTPRSCHLPVAICPGNAERTKAARCEVVDRLSDSGLRRG